MGSLTNHFFESWCESHYISEECEKMFFETLNSPSSCFNFAKPPNHTLYHVHPPLQKNPPLYFPVAVTGGSWGFGWTLLNSCTKDPHWGLLTGCPLSSVPISPWPSPHLGRCSERSTGGGREDLTLLYNTYPCIFLRFELGNLWFYTNLNIWLFILGGVICFPQTSILHNKTLLTEQSRVLFTVFTNH